jgi:hypothetical protein
MAGQAVLYDQRLHRPGVGCAPCCDREMVMRRGRSPTVSSKRQSPGTPRSLLADQLQLISIVIVITRAARASWQPAAGRVHEPSAAMKKLYLHTADAPVEFSKVFKVCTEDDCTLLQLVDRFASALHARHPGALPPTSTPLLLDQHRHRVDAGLAARAYAQRAGEADLFVQWPGAPAGAAQPATPAGGPPAEPGPSQAASSSAANTAPAAKPAGAAKQRVAASLAAAAAMQLAERAAASGQLAKAVGQYEQVRCLGCHGSTTAQHSAPATWRLLAAGEGPPTARQA